jgi:hypothetical protein
METEDSLPLRSIHTRWYEAVDPPGAQTASPFAAVANCTAPAPTSVATPWAINVGVPRTASDFSSTDDGVERAAAREDEMPSGRPAALARALDQHLAFAGRRPHRFDAGVVVVLGRRLGVAGEEHGAAVRQRLRPAVRAFVAGLVERRDRFHRAALLRNARQAAQRVGREIDEAVAAPGGAARLARALGETDRRPASDRDLEQAVVAEEADPVGVGREEWSVGALGLGHARAANSSRVRTRMRGVPLVSTTIAASRRPSSESASCGYSALDRT